MSVVNNEEKLYGIKYEVISLNNKKYLLYPKELITGEETEDGFETEDGLVPLSYQDDALDSKYVVDMIFSKDELEFVYEIDDDEEFLLNYFFDDFKNILIYINEDYVDGITRNEIDLRTFDENFNEVSYVFDKSIPSVVLNYNALSELSNCKSINDIKLKLTKYRTLLQEFSDSNKNKAVTRINVLDGKIETVETMRKVSEDVEKEYGISCNIINEKDLEEKVYSDVTYRGLKEYIKERVFGHDEEIDTFAQKLYMNYTAIAGDIIESILLVGPTGVGKTETVNAACNYLNIPTFKVNASNIVPQGIKGMSIEDVIVGLFVDAGYDEKKAERGLIFLDEFDKLNESDLETKTAVKNILLTFTAGGVFPIDNDQFTFTFDSSMTNKVYAGVFQNILNNCDKHIGFSDIEKKEKILNSEELMREKIISCGYFTLEELSRISCLLGFSEIDKETKRKILLESKLSELVLKKDRYKRQFGVDLVATDDYIDAIIEELSSSATGMRSVNNLVKRTMNHAERELLEENNNGKKLVLTKNTVNNIDDFDIC